MRLNQVTVTMPDLDGGWDFYRRLGLIPVVDARPRYARFLCPDGDSTFSLHQGDVSGGGTTVYFECDDLDRTVSRLIEAGILFASVATDQSWLWREAELFDPGGNRIVLYFAGATASIRPGACNPTRRLSKSVYFALQHGLQWRQ